MKGKRPKVRYVADRKFPSGGGPEYWIVCHVNFGDTVLSYICDCDTRSTARRIAAALNFHEAHKRGEL